MVARTLLPVVRVSSSSLTL